MPENDTGEDVLASLATCIRFFEYVKSDGTVDRTAFLKDWKELSEDDKYQIRKGIGLGTFDYDPTETAPPK